MGKSTRKKPKKPHLDFPLYPHAVGKWAKTIRGKTFYFGTWGDPEGALQQYLDEKDELYGGRVPKSRSDALRIRDLCNQFLRHCQVQVEAGEMVKSTLKSYEQTTDRIVRVFGKNQFVEHLQPRDFAKLREDIAKRNGPVSRANIITRCRVVFNYAVKNHLIEGQIRYGVAFQRPSAKTLRKAKASSGSKMFTADECRLLIDNASSPQLKAMILLALNCGYGNADVAQLPIDAVDLDRGWIHFPRPKTGIDRRCRLWGETKEALQEVLAGRSKNTKQVFVTKFGNSFFRDEAAITKVFRRLLNQLGLYKPGRNFYALRHVFRTVADSSKDFPAIRLIMGHVDSSIDAHYRESIDDDRLVAVVEHVHGWLYSKD